MSEGVMSGRDSGEVRVGISSAWCILRTSGGRTLALTASLGGAGFDVWTPIERVSRRRPRSKIRREFDAPILPTFVFARAGHLADLARCLALPVNPHPAFSILRYGGKIPIISDDELVNLRLAESRAQQAVERARHKSYRKVFADGQRVRLDDGPFAGMSGVVQGGDGRFAEVSFGGHGQRIKIATWLLTPDDIEQTQSITDTAARAA